MIVGTVIGLCLFILPLWAYRRGMKDMKAIMEGKTPEPITNPVEAIQKHVEQRQEAKQTKAEQDKFSEGFGNLMNYDPFAKPEVKHGEN